jgi:hypothetical protein
MISGTGTAVRPHRTGPPGSDLLPGPAAAHASRTFRDDVGARPRGAVCGLDQDPAALAGAGQGEASGQLAAVQGDRQVARVIAGDLSGSLIPDDHGAAAPPLSFVHALELSGRQLVIFDRDGQAAHRRIQRGSLRDGPGAQHLAGRHSGIDDWVGLLVPYLQPIVKGLDESIRAAIPGLHCAVKWKRAFYGLPGLGWIIEIEQAGRTPGWK